MRLHLFGNNIDRMPDFAFRIMSLIFAVRDRLAKPWSVLDRFGIGKGMTVVDYGCGPGSYLRRASELVGPDGRVFGVDVHELAVRAVTRRIRREGLANVTAVLAKDDRTSLPERAADVIYALDMFHMVGAPERFLKELNRISKDSGLLYIDNGHQSRESARSKIERSGAWEVVGENGRHMVCRPVKGKA